jgi:hypothetical protein
MDWTSIKLLLFRLLLMFVLIQHKRFLQECKEKDPDVLFIGDSIIESLQFTETWNTFFAPLHCLNFSIQQDRVENVLWRIENGELEFVKPKVSEHMQIIKTANP